VEEQGRLIFKRRTPTTELLVSDVNPSTHVRVSIIGTVLNVDSRAFICGLEDVKKNKLVVLLPRDEFLTKLKPGGLVRITGLVVPYEQGFELRAESVQDMTGLTVQVYLKYLELKSEHSLTKKDSK